ncbi:PAS domain-containing protein [Falsiroseomonas sp. CW058]|uniref:PAS domain-containing protein n=1 Tax=Falsiroseomonas sp. CW058 TaxID=3388664 RepID=UPI003D3163B0
MQRTAWRLAFVTASLACIGVWATSVLVDRRTVLDAAGAKLATTARLLELHADRALETGDRIIRAGVLAAADLPRPEEEERAQRLAQTLHGLVEGGQQIASVWVMDAAGFLVAESWSHPPASRGPFADRPYFQAHRDGEGGLHVGALALGPSVRRLRFTLSRPLLAADGAFAGVVAAGVLSDHFAAAYAESGLGADARLALVRQDGAPLAIWPPPADLAEAASVIGAMTRAGTDGQLAAERQLARFPVKLVVRQGTDGILAEWRRRAWMTGGMVAAVIAALAGLTALGLRGAAAQRALVGELREERGMLERRVAERTRELAEGEARLRDTLESMTDAFIALDRDFRVVDVNAHALRLDGRPAAEILGRTHWELWPASVGTRVEEAYRGVMETRAPVQFEHHYVSDRHDAWLDIRAVPVASGIALFYTDISERKRAEVALRESEEMRRLATEGAQVGVWEVCLVTGQGHRSAEAMALLGVAEADFRAADWLEVVHPQDRARVAAAWRGAMEGGAYAVEFRAAAPDAAGRERWLLARGRAERDADGRPRRAIGVMIDVSDRVRAEAETRAALAELRLVYDTAPVGLCVFDLQGRFRRVNERLAAINGLPAEAHIGRTAREVVPAIADAAEQLLRMVIETGEPVLNVEIAGETPAQPGIRRVWEEHWYPLFDAAGRIAGVNVVAEEVTERKNAEQRQLLLAREVDHRAKNALTMVQSVLRLTRAEDPKAFARAVEGRVAALARAQGLLAEVRWTGVELRALLAAELAAFLPAEGAIHGAPGLHLDGPSVTLAPLAAQPLSMIVHELATNATKYGALSAAGGMVALSWRVDAAAGMLRLRWAESGGPPVEAAPERRGFGSRVIEMLTQGQLGGTVSRRWDAAGLVCDIALPVARVLAPPDPAAPSPLDVALAGKAAG